MAIPTIYRLLNKSDNVFRQYRNPEDVAIFFLGRRVGNYIVIKSDQRGDRLVVLENFEFNAIKQSLSEA